MTTIFENGWPKEEIFKKYERGEELTGEEALAFIASLFSNATHGNYEAEALMERIPTAFIIKIKKDPYERYD